MTEEITEAKPLELDWCCGVNTNIGVLDLTTPDRDTTVAFAANHVVVIQNPEADGHFPLLGHRNNVSCLAASPCKRWIASGDYGTSPSVIIWNIETHKGLQVIDGNSHTSIGTGIASISFSSDSKTLMILASNSVLTFWRWTDEIPYLYHAETLDTPISMLNCPTITSREVQTFEIYIITCPDKLIYLHTQIKNENVNIDGEIISRDKLDLLIETIAPEEEEIGSLKTGWEFGNSVFISDTETVTYFKRGNGALILTTRQVIKGVEQWKNLKMIKFSERPLTSLDLFEYEKSIVIVVADSTGYIRFLSSELKILYWLKLPKLSPLRSFSLSSCKPELAGEDAEALESTLDPKEFLTPSFTAVTTNGCIYNVKNGKPKIIFEGAPEGDLKVVAHPFKEIIIVAGKEQLRIMDTSNTGKFEVRNNLENETITCLNFNKDGAELVVGCKSGSIYQLDTFSLKILKKLEPSEHSVIDVIYSATGLYIATADASHAITMWERGDTASNEWKHMGRYRPHSQEIIQLLFIDEYGTEKLLSLARDRKLVEYIIEDQLKISSQYRIEADAVPTCLIQYPSGRFEEEFLFTANDKFKLRLFNQSTKLPRRITNSQKYDSPIKKLIARPGGLDVVAFVTNTCLGLMELPIDGNPNREFGVLGNPCGITDAAAGLTKIITVGPGVISAWKADEKALEKHRMKGGLGMAPFYALLDDQEFKLLQDVFYFCQLETQGIATDTKREVSRSISIDKVPDAVRALGWFPTELQIEELLTEIKFSKFHKTQEQATSVDLDDFIKLYLNHRPVDQISMEEVENAFNILSEDGTLNPGELMHTLENFGEKMGQAEINECLDRLCGQNQFQKLVDINSKDFVNNILRL